MMNDDDNKIFNLIIFSLFVDHIFLCFYFFSFWATLVFQVESWIAQGQGKSKKSAKKLAAENLLNMISDAVKVSTAA